MTDKDLSWIALQSATGIADSLDEAMMVADVVFDPDDRAVDIRIIAVNEHFAPMTGLSARAGQTLRGLAPDLEQYWFDIMERVVRTRESLQVENGSAALGRWFAARYVPVEPFPRFMMLFRDITEARQAAADAAAEVAGLQRELSESRAALDVSRMEKAEMRHRMTNTLAIIASITAMEARALIEKEGRAALSRVRDRVAAAGELFRTLEGRDVPDTVSADVFLGAIATGLEKSLHGGAEFSTSLVPVEIASRIAVPLGLILNELVTNAVKYGAAPDEMPKVHIGLRTGDDAVVLSVADKGPGIVHRQPQGTGLGQRLIQTFADQIGARVARRSGPGGTTVEVAFPA